MTETLHYAGRLRIATKRRVTHIGGGYAACCVGDRAYRIADEGRNTYEPSEVTCKLCLKQIQRAEFGERMWPMIQRQPANGAGEGA